MIDQQERREGRMLRAVLLHFENVANSLGVSKEVFLVILVVF